MNCKVVYSKETVSSSEEKVVKLTVMIVYQRNNGTSRLFLGNFHSEKSKTPTFNVKSLNKF